METRGVCVRVTPVCPGLGPTVADLLSCKADAVSLCMMCYRLSWHVVPVCPVRNDCSEGNGRSEDKKGKKKGDKDFHSEISLAGLGA